MIPSFSFYMKRQGIFFVLILLVFSTADCATIFSKRKHSVFFESNQKGAIAEYKYDADTTVKTFTLPGNLEINFRSFKFNQNDPYVDIHCPGYETKRVFITRRFSAWVFMNYLLFITTPFHLTDVLTGAIWVPLYKRHYIEFKNETMKNQIQSEAEKFKDIKTLSLQ
ncbi:MAG: hypothetical protein OEZ34_00495 [Spirochaetia bacterium]|nr:hypothetical protein [Spirochaetia bacterium]